MFAFEWTFRAGDLLTFVGTMGGGLSVAGAFLYRRGGADATTAATLQALAIEVGDSKRETKESIERNERATRDSIASMQSEIKKIGEVLINQADQNRRIIHLEDDVRELRHGRGFIKASIDGEYP
jgi:hypothetical protein